VQNMQAFTKQFYTVIPQERHEDWSDGQGFANWTVAVARHWVHLSRMRPHG